MSDQALEDGKEADVPGSELRGAARFGVLIRPAKLVVDDFEIPVVMRDVSETGISVKLFHPIPDKAVFAIEMLNGVRYDLELVWQKGLAAGFRFEHAVDLTHILSNAGPFPNRPIRLFLQFPATIEHGARKANAIVTNFSQQGARLLCADHIAIAQLVAMEAQGLPRIRAKVRWRHDSQYGLVFEDTFTLSELSDIATRMRAAALADGGSTISGAA